MKTAHLTMSGNPIPSHPIILGACTCSITEVGCVFRLDQILGTLKPATSHNQFAAFKGIITLELEYNAIPGK